MQELGREVGAVGPADRRSDLLDAKVSRQFVWLVGIQVMTLAAVVTSLATILSAISGR